MTDSQLDDLIEYHDGTVTMTASYARDVAKRSGLKSKSSRKIMKRVKKVLNEALRAYLKEME